MRVVVAQMGNVETEMIKEGRTQHNENAAGARRAISTFVLGNFLVTLSRGFGSEHLFSGRRDSMP